MTEFIEESVFFGAFVSILAYEIGAIFKKKFGFAIFNPLLLGIAIVMILLIVLDIPYETYNTGAKYISYLLTPATVCLAIPLYEQFELLKKNALAIVAGILSGVITSCVSIFVLSKLFSLDYEMYATLLPKSITTAIGMGVSEELGGYVTITVAAIIVTGIFGNMAAETICRIFRITEPVAKGVAIGTASHAVGTAKAIEIGDVEGAMSGLSIAVAGLLTVIAAPIFANLYI